MPDRKPTIVVVDDETPVMELVVASLTGKDEYHVHGFSRSAEVIPFYLDPSNTLDVLITDLVMPRLDGAALARQVKAARPNIKIILMTGNPCDVEYADLLLAGAAILSKPFSPAALATLVRQMLGGQAGS